MAIAGYRTTTQTEFSLFRERIHGDVLKTIVEFIHINGFIAISNRIVPPGPSKAHMHTPNTQLNFEVDVVEPYPFIS